MPTTDEAETVPEYAMWLWGISSEKTPLTDNETVNPHSLFVPQSDGEQNDAD